MFPQFLGVKEIGIITGISSKNLTNFRRSHKDFPIPFAEVSGNPVYDINTVVNWLTNNSIEFDLSLLENKRRKDIEKQLYVVGPERAGKSRFVSKLCTHEYILRECLDNITSQRTRIVHKFVIRKFCPESMCCIRYVNPNSTLHNMRAPLEVTPILDFFKKIENENYNTLSNGGGLRNLDPNEDIIEVYVSASPLASAILDDEDDGIIVYDTPNIYGNSNLSQISGVGSYLIMLNDNIQEVRGKDIAKMISPMADTKAVVTCWITDQVDDYLSYNKLCKKAESIASMFVNSFKKYVDLSLVVNKTNQLLQSKSIVVPMGSFKSTEINYAERKFNEEIAKALKQMLSHNTPLMEEDYIANMLCSKQNDQSAIEKAKNYVKQICSKVLEYITVHKQGAYTQQFYLEEGHSVDEYKEGKSTIYEMRKSMNQLQIEVYESFCNLKLNDGNKYFTQEEQEQLIMFCYKKIHEALHTDCGIAHGYHNFESSPPIALWIHESVVADKLAAIHPFNLTSPETLAATPAYVDCMSKLFFSQTWGYVKIRPPYTGRISYCNRKIEVLSRCKLYKLAAENINQYISNCYNVGLLMLGIYSILNHFTKSYSLTDDDIETVGKLADVLIK